jgi:hypothetical protein
MLAGYVSLGFDPAAFWGLTLRMYMAHTKGAMQRLEREHGERAWQAWMTAALPLMKKMPRLEELTKRNREKPDIAFRLSVLSASLPRITQEEWRARVAANK